MHASRIIADMRPGDECGDPDYPGLRGRCTTAARVADYLDTLTVRNVVPLRAA